MIRRAAASEGDDSGVLARGLSGRLAARSLASSGTFFAGFRFSGMRENVGLVGFFGIGRWEQGRKKPVFDETKIDRRRLPTAPLKIEMARKVVRVE